MRPTPARPIRSVQALVEAGLAGPEAAAALAEVAERYAIALTPHVSGQIRSADDPIARQFVPTTAELRLHPAERADPIGDHAHAPLPGLVRRYPDRVLLKAVHVCPVYCRFCFRREQVGPGGAMLSEPELDAALDWIAGQDQLWEVILTGGDPLVMRPAWLQRVLGRLAQIPHVQVVRVHTRVPVVDPARVDDALIEALSAFVPVWVGVHSNHADELGAPGVKAALDRLARAGLPLVGQTVLLAGVNDEVGAMEALLRGMVRMRIKPYYLHHGDLAPGTAHFRTRIAHGQGLMAALRGRVSGLCLPTYVLDLPGGHGKVPLLPSALRGQDPDGAWIVDDPWGGQHRYREALP
jgi:lysine 2,3-aminomutase